MADVTHDPDYGERQRYAAIRRPRPSRLARLLARLARLLIFDLAQAEAARFDADYPDLPRPAMRAYLDTPPDRDTAATYTVRPRGSHTFSRN